MKRLVLALPAVLALSIATCRPDVHVGALGFDADRASRTVQALTRQCPERRPEGACGRRALLIIRDTLRASRYQVQEQQFDPGGRRISLMAVRRGRRPGEVILAAHHDTVPGSPGALDDAAGVALVLEVARALSRRSDGRSIRFLFTDGEEDGLLGSRAYVRSLRKPERERIAAAVAVEMPGAREGAPVIHTFPPLRGPARGRLPPAQLLARSFAAARAASVDLSLGDPSIALAYQVLVRNVRVPFASDDMPFAAEGVPAFFYSDSSLTRFYPHYHQASDTASSLDRRAFSRAGRVVEAIVRDLTFGGPVARGCRTPPDGVCGSSEAIVWGTRVSRGPLLWAGALLLLLPLASALRRSRPGGPILLAAGYLWTLLLSVPTAVLLLGAALVVSPWAGSSRAALRVAKVVGLAPAVVCLAVYVMAARLGADQTLGAGRAMAIVLGLAGLVVLRARR